MAGEKNGVFTLIYDEEEEHKRKEKKKKVKLNDITKTISNIFTGISIDNKYEFIIRKKKYFFFEKSDLLEKSDQITSLINK